MTGDAMDAAVRLVLATFGVTGLITEVDGDRLMSVTVIRLRSAEWLDCDHRVRRGEIAGRLADGRWFCLDCTIRRLRTPVGTAGEPSAVSADHPTVNRGKAVAF
jgi:hypothetical protein